MQGSKMIQPFSRRELLERCGTGLGMLALAGICAADNPLSAAPVPLDPLAPKAPHFPARAKHVIHLFMNGGPSHVDTFDPKPASTSITASRCN